MIYFCKPHDKYHKVARWETAGITVAWCGCSLPTAGLVFLMVDMIEPDGGGCKTCYELPGMFDD